MLILNRENICALTHMPHMIEGLREAFRVGCIVPARRVLPIPGTATDRFFLSMPAFDHQGGSAIKLVTVFPDNQMRELPAIHAVIVVFSEAGVPTALLDGTMLTHFRTGAVSALASTYLSRLDSSHLVIIGAGALAPAMAAAHCAVRPITRVSICARRREQAIATAAAIKEHLRQDVQVLTPESTEEAVATADIVCCATSSPTPVLAGRWLKSGTFVDLVGSFRPSKRETDDAVVERSRIFVDTFQGALSEAGDILDPISRGIIDRKRIEGELADLVCGRVPGRNNNDEITLFKSVGTALADFAAAHLIISAANSHSPPQGFLVTL